MNLSGVVRDKSTGETLPSANIYLSDLRGNPVKPTKGTSTGIDGNYTFLVDPGSWITVSYVGYKPATLQPSQSRTNIDLEPATAELDPFVVIGKKRKNYGGVVAGISLVALIAGAIASSKS